MTDIDYLFEELETQIKSHGERQLTNLELFSLIEKVRKQRDYDNWRKVNWEK